VRSCSGALACCARRAVQGPEAATIAVVVKTGVIACLKQCTSTAHTRAATCGYHTHSGRLQSCETATPHRTPSTSCACVVPGETAAAGGILPDQMQGPWHAEQQGVGGSTAPASPSPCSACLCRAASTRNAGGASAQGGVACRCGARRLQPASVCNLLIGAFAAEPLLSVATMSVPVAAIPIDPSCSRDLMVWHRQAAGPCGPGRLRGRAPFCRRTASHARRSRSCSQREATASAAVGSAPHDVAHRCSDHGVSVGRPAVVVVRAVHDQEPAAGQALLSRRMPSRRPSRAPALHAARLQLQVGVRGVP